MAFEFFFYATSVAGNVLTCGCCLPQFSFNCEEICESMQILSVEGVIKSLKSLTFAYDFSMTLSLLPRIKSAYFYIFLDGKVVSA